MCVYGQHSLDSGERRHLRECIRQRGDRRWILSTAGQIVVGNTAAQHAQNASKSETGGYHVCAHAHNRQARWYLLHARNARLWQRLLLTPDNCRPACSTYEPTQGAAIAKLGTNGIPAGIPQKGKRFHVCVCGHHSLDGGERRHLRECIRQRGDRL